MVQPTQTAGPGPAQRRAPRGLAGLLDQLFLWLPRAENPGVAAVLLFLVRHLVLSWLLIFLIFLPVASLAVAEGGSWSAAAAGLLPVLVFGCLDLVQGLGRYSFIRYAERPLRAVAIFTATIVGELLLFNHDKLLSLAWMIPAQFAAAAAIYFGVRMKANAVALVLAIFVAQAALDVGVPPLMHAANPGRPAPARHDPEPAVGDMQTWGKIYPGAVVSESRTQQLMTLTSWRATYTAHATPAEIDAFYNQAADAAGFSDKITLAGLHRFTEPGTGDNFSYLAVVEGNDVRVVFEARAFDQP